MGHFTPVPRALAADQRPRLLEPRAAMVHLCGVAEATAVFADERSAAEGGEETAP